MGPDVSVCVAVYRTHDPPNLATLAAQLPAACDGLEHELVVALNGIGADAAGVPDDAKVVHFAVNRGVSVAWNQAASRAAGEYLLFLNDDVALGHRAVTLVVRGLREAPDAGVAGPVGTRWDIAVPRHIAHVRGAGEPGALAACEVVSGFFLATPAKVFQRVGGFDEAYTPCSFEEVDYCTTVRLELGLACYQVAGIDYRHDFGVSAKSRWRRIRYDGRSESIGRIARRNREHFRAKWADRVGRLDIA